MLLDLEQYVARAKLMASPLRLGEWLLERFGEEIVEQRRAHERAVKSLETEPPPAPAAPMPAEAVSARKDRSWVGASIAIAGAVLLGAIYLLLANR